jgi:exosortase A
VTVADRVIVTAAAIDPAARRPAPSLVWMTHLIALYALVGLLCVFNAQAIAAAVRVWWVSPTFSHCFFVIPVSAYLVWGRRHALARLTPVAYPPALVLFPPLVLISLAAKVTHINEAEQLAVVSLLQVLILGILGPQVYRRILFPSLFLFFLVPMGEYLIVPLQHFTTHFVSAGLTLLGIPHYTEMTLIQLSNGDYEVAEACAGLRFLIATIAVSVLFVHLTYRKWHKIVIYLVASLVVPPIANGFRALGIVLVAHWTDNRIATGVDHVIYGWGFLVAILTVLMVIGMRYADPIPSVKDDGAVITPAPRPRALALTVVLSLAAICFGPALLYRANHQASRVNTAAFSAPLRPIGWQTSAAWDGWSPQYASPDAPLALTMREASSGAVPVDVFVNYYSGSNDSHTLISSTNKLWDEDVWHPLSQGTTQAELGGRMLRLREAVIRSTGVTRIIWWTYWSAGHFTTSQIDVKLDSLRQALSGGGGSALLAVSTPVDADTDEARARLRRALGALGAISVRLDAVSRS